MNIPTSLIVVLLVVAWLVVLVPMVARRREKVPQAEPAGSGFRVLRRASASLRRRPRGGAKGRTVTEMDARRFRAGRTDGGSGDSRGRRGGPAGPTPPTNGPPPKPCTAGGSVAPRRASAEEHDW